MENVTHARYIDIDQRMDKDCVHGERGWGALQHAEWHAHITTCHSIAHARKILCEVSAVSQAHHNSAQQRYFVAKHNVPAAPVKVRRRPGSPFSPERGRPAKGKDPAAPYGSNMVPFRAMHLCKVIQDAGKECV